jgi:hypothetical protein
MLPSFMTSVPCLVRTFTLLIVLVSAWPAGAQPPDAASPPPRATEIELNVINLPTTRSLARHGSYFRLTHRFARDLRRGSFGQLAEDLFSLDNGAIIGLEYRFGLADNLQVGVHRSILNKTIQVFGRFDAWHQSDTAPVSLSLVGSIEGLDNLTERHQPAIAAALSRSVGSHLMLYTMPAFVARTARADGIIEGSSEHTLMIGLGSRLQVRPSVFVAGEYTPRVAGHDPGRGTWAVAVEKKTDGHTLQINFTNSSGTTLGQMARVGSEHDIYLGFNITRLF